MIERELWEKREGRRTKYPGNFVPLKSVQEAKKRTKLFNYKRSQREKKTLADKKKEQSLIKQRQILPPPSRLHLLISTFLPLAKEKEMERKEEKPGQVRG